MMNTETIISKLEDKVHMLEARIEELGRKIDAAENYRNTLDRDDPEFYVVLRRVIGYEQTRRILRRTLSETKLELAKHLNIRAIEVAGYYLNDYEHEFEHFGTIRGTKL